MPSDDQNTSDQKVLALVREAIAHDEELRGKYQVGDKFRFVRERLKGLVEQLEAAAALEHTTIEKLDRTVATNEVAVFVYLFNAHGLNLRTWQNMITPKTFYEYSVNRPIYTQKNHIETLLRSKTNKMQHGYLEVIVRADDIIPSATELKDSAGNAVIKVKEGALRFEDFIAFYHNGSRYGLTAEGELIKKD